MPALRLAFSQSAARWLLGGLLASLAAGACAAPALSAEPAECAAIDESALEQAYAQWSREAAQALREHAKALAARGDSRSQLMAMYVMRAIDADPLDQSQSGSDREKQRQFYQQAVREGQPAEPAALWLSQGLCAGKKAPADKPGAAAQPGEFRSLQANCDPQALLERLARQEPDNAAPWLALAALHPEGSAGREQALQRAAEAPRALFYERRLGPLLHEAFQNVAWPEPSKQLELAGLNLPGLSDLNEKESISDTYAVGLWAAVPYNGLTEMRQMCSQTGSACRKPQAACRRYHAPASAAVPHHRCPRGRRAGQPHGASDGGACSAGSAHRRRAATGPLEGRAAPAPLADGRLAAQLHRQIRLARHAAALRSRSHAPAPARSGPARNRARRLAAAERAQGGQRQGGRLSGRAFKRAAGH